MTVSQTFFFGCLSFITGVAFASSWRIGQIGILTVFICGIFLVSVFWRRKQIAAAGALFLCAAFGLWIYEASERTHIDNELQKFYGEDVVFQAKVIKQPIVRASGTQVTVKPDFVSSGNVLITFDAGEKLSYGDRVVITGTLREPESFDDFDYAAFLAKDGVYALMKEPKVEIKERGVYEYVGERAMAVIFNLKAEFREVLEKHLSPRFSSVMVEMLLGDKYVMSEGLAQDLNATGLRHIIAISGAHIAILTMYMMPLLIWLGLWRQQAFYVTLALVIFYVVLTGLQPSAVRSGLMGGMFLLGQHVGRQYVALRALIFAATAMLLLNPFLLARDVGFQLSFLAVFGMIVLLPTVLSFLPKKIPARELLAMTLAAQIFTLPILIWNFGQVSLVSVITNILIVPVIPLLMGLGFLLMIGGLLGPVGFLLAFPVGILVQYILWIVDFFADLPFAAVKTENFSAFWLLPFYAFVAFFWWRFRKKREGFVLP
ncbi:MAG: ComEC/Rec2 family competence protein [Candidatus Wildermuthbacteria bacterium]|nr:ComEC/Rec2 family competence protein [Candidatus Wildermuthbacteria bacterium]